MTIRSLAIVIPTYNEAKNVTAMVTALRALPFPDLGIFIVDDNSPDGTGALADELAAKPENRLTVIHRPGKFGLGTAYQAGFRAAIARRTEAIAQLDCDFSHPPDALIRMAELLGSYDVVVGSRYVPGGGLDKRWDIGRKLLSRWAVFYAKTILGLKVHDPTAGFKLWRRETLIGVNLNRIHSNGYVFLVEMAYITQKLGYRVCEIPITFEERQTGKSKMSMGVKIEAAWRVWQLRLRHNRLQPRDRALEP
ncbi:MAG: polyprenol monophosphomannose synthase [Anaerolineales bacterium]|nr:polyprenol monophosphomannose synthase [Anaerolineales bacterium]